MKTKEMDIYSVKLVYKYVVHSQKPQVLYEEQILRIKAESFEDAYKKADEYAASYIDKYTNINGDTVEISLYKAVDCFMCFEEDNGIQEVYSGFFNADENLLKSVATACEADELQILRHK